MTKICKWLCLSFFSLLLVSACAPSGGTTRRYFWPPPPDQPRIEYIHFYLSGDDLQEGNDSYLMEAVFGKERPKGIFSRPTCIAANGKGLVIVSDAALRKVAVLDLIRREIRYLRDAKGNEHSFPAPNGVAFDETGWMYVVDSQEHQVYAFNPQERLVGAFGKEVLTRPTGITFDPVRQVFHLVDTGAHAVVLFDRQGEYLRTVGRRGGGPGEFNFPLDADTDGEGNLYVLDSLNARVQVFSPEGEFLRAFGERGTALGSFQLPKGIAVSPSGLVLVTDAQGHRFVVFDRQGKHLLTVGGESAMTRGKIAPGGFYMPHDIEADATDAIWVVDTLNRIIHRFQYLNDAYLKEHPVRPGEAVLPPELREP